MKLKKTLATLLVGGVLAFGGEVYANEPTPNASKSYKDCKIVGEDRPKGNWDIYVMDFDGSNKTNLTNTPFGFFERHAKWSPDGKKIMYCTETSRRGSRKEQPEYAGEIYVMNSDGSGKQNLTNNPARDDNSSWSPDGKRIIFVSNRDENSEIYVMNSDGTELRNLSNNASRDYGPSWSPDGSKIAFLSTRDHKEFDRRSSTKKDRNIEIYIMNSDGINLRNITNDIGMDTYPSWSPDGKKIGFTSIRNFNSDVYIIDCDGSNLQRLTTYSGNDTFIGWSPDQRYVYFISDREKGPTKTYMNMGDYKVYFMESDGSNLKKLIDNIVFDILWTPDGKKMIIPLRKDGVPGLYTMNPDGTDIHKFLDDPLSNMSFSPPAP